MNQDHSVIFEIAPKYCILDSSVDYEGYSISFKGSFLGGSDRRNLPAMWETWVLSLGCKDPLEKEMATHSNILAWRIPWTEELGGLYSPWGHKELNTTERLSLSVSFHEGHSISSKGYFAHSSRYNDHLN